MSNALIIKPLPWASITASSTAAGYDAAYMGNDHMGVVWKSAGGESTCQFAVDMGENVLIDTALLLGCTGAAAGWTLKVDTLDTAWFGETLPFLAGAAMPVTGRGRALWLAPASPPPPSRYWRFTIGGLNDAPATVARLILGRKIQLSRNVVYGASFGVRDLGSVDFSRRGILLRQSGAKLRTVNISYPAATRAEVESYVHPLLEELGNTGALAFILDPDADAQRQNRIWYGPMIGDLGTVWANVTGFEWRANIVDLGA